MARAFLHTHWHEIVTDDFALEIAVAYTARPGTWDEPGDAPEIEVQSATFLSQYGWASYPLSDAECDAIEAECDAIEADIAELHDFTPDGPDPDDVRDRMLDDMLMARVA